MSRPKIDFASLRDRTVPLGDGRARALESAVVHRHARHAARVRIGQIATALATMALVALAVVLVVRRRPVAVVASSPAPSVSTMADVSAANGDTGGVVMSDGSRATFLVAGTELAQSGATGRQCTLVRGAARFDVVHDAGAPFRVTAGSVVIEDVGTVFTVRLADDGGVLVSVESGSVSVRGAEGERTLVAGASESFARAAPAVEPPASPSSSTPPSAPWQKLARAGQYDRAYAMIENGGASVPDEPEQLLLAADSARLSGHNPRAAAFLRRLVDKFPADSRAGLAAFTLGRVLLDDLGQPRDAARAFATAESRGGPLTEDALAREVEAWTRAGDHAAAKTAAARYLASYPMGRHAAFVRRLAGEP